MTEATLELLGTIQRFFGWLRMHADLYDRDTQDNVREIADSLSSQIETLIDEEDADDN